MKIPPNLRTADRCDKCKYCDTTRSKNVMDICTKHDNYAVFWNNICDDYEPRVKDETTS